MKTKTEALRICTEALRELVDTDHIYSEKAGKSISFADLDRMTKNNNHNGRVIKTNKSLKSQINLQHVAFDAGVALVDCGNCGETFLHDSHHEVVDCPYCGRIEDSAGNPDHFCESDRTIESEAKECKSYFHICVYNGNDVEQFPERFATLEDARLYSDNEDYTSYVIGEYITTDDGLQLWVKDHSIKSEQKKNKKITITITLKG